MKEKALSSATFMKRLQDEGILPAHVRSCQITATLGEPVRVSYTYYERHDNGPSLIRKGEVSS